MSYIIKWKDSDPDSNAQITLYYDFDNQGLDGVEIIGGIQEDDPTDAYTWDTSSTPEGTYYIYARIDDGENPPAYDYSDGTLTITHNTDDIPPATITTLRVTQREKYSIALQWVAPGDDEDIGQATSYDLRYSTSMITDENWDNATQVEGESAPKPGGEDDFLVVKELSQATTYYFAIKSEDEAANVSGLSNISSGSTLFPHQYQQGFPYAIHQVGSSMSWHPEISPVVGDLNKDGCKEILFTLGAGVYAVQYNGTNLPGWPREMSPNSPHLEEAGVAMGDVDADGDNELVTMSVDNDERRIFIYHHDGTLVSGWPVVVPAISRFGDDVAPILVDLDNDGDLEILVFSKGIKTNFYAFHHDGTPVPGWPVVLEESFYGSSAMADMDQNGYPEIVAFSNGGNLYAFEHDGGIAPGWPVWVGGKPRNRSDKEGNKLLYMGDNVVIGDIDGDGDLEIVLYIWADKTTDTGIIVAHHHDGNPVAGFPWTPPVGMKISGFALGDFDQNGDLEVVLHVYKGTSTLEREDWVYVLNHDGSSFNGWPAFIDSIERARTRGGLVVGDIDGDGNIEVVVGGTLDGVNSPERAYAFNHDGSPVFDWPIAAYGEIRPTMALSDLDGDNDVEIIGLTYSYSGPLGYVAVWDLPHHLDSDKMQWPMFQHDRRRSGYYGWKEPENIAPAIKVTHPPAEGAQADISYIIRWTDSDPDDNARILLYYDTDNTGYDGVQIVSGISEDDSTNAYTWNTSSIPQGSYYIYAKIHDSVNTTAYDYSDGVLTIAHSPPETTITGGPSGVINEDKTTFIWTGSDDITPAEDLLYSYRLNNQVWSEWSSKTSWTAIGLVNGDHTFYVRAKNGAGNVDPSPASREFTVDLLVKANWPKQRADLAQTGYSIDKKIYPPLELKWNYQTEETTSNLSKDEVNNLEYRKQERGTYTFDLGEGKTSYTCTSPAVVDGVVVFVGSVNGKVYAVDADTGNTIWSWDVGTKVESSPAVAGGMVYIGANDGRVYAFDLVTGQIKWSHQVTSLMVSPCVVVANGLVYSGVEDVLYALDAETGNPRWSHSGDGGVYLPTIEDGVIYIGFASGQDYHYRLFALDTATGTPKWDSPVSIYYGLTSPMIEDGLIYIAGDQKLYAIEAKTGKVEWTHEDEGGSRYLPIRG